VPASLPDGLLDRDVGDDRRRARRHQHRRWAPEGAELRPDPRVAVNVVDPDDVRRFYEADKVTLPAGE
jgi:hypothetical protein